MSPEGADGAHNPASTMTDKSHPIPIGQTVTVFRLPHGAPPLIEGRAIVLCCAPSRHLYEVHFVGDPVARIRLVHPACQQDPDGVLAMMVELWWAEQTMGSAIDDFFPIE